MKDIDYLLEWISRDERCYNEINSFIYPDTDGELERKATLQEIRGRIKTNRIKLHKAVQTHFIEQALLIT